MATAGDQIKRALRLLGVLAAGETPTTDEYADALVTLNQMLDSWSTERLSVYCTQDQAFTWPAGQATRTLGPSGNLGTGIRPVSLDPSTYYVYGGISYTPIQVNQDQYNDIALKTATTTLPQVMFVNPTNPNLTMTLYPVPTADLAFHFISVVALSEPAATSTTLAFPPGYLRAFAYNLAMELAPEFGVEPSPQVKRIAVVSKRNLKRINNPNDLLAMPTAMVANRSGFNVYTGGF